MQRLRVSHVRLTRLLLVIALMWSNVSNAKVVEIPQPGGIILTAEYHQGDADKPVVMLMHGFLQTRESRTVYKLFTALSDAGYSVLSPTLSLGISTRNQSLACEALHVHSMQSDIKEIDVWNKWLTDKSFSNIILLGHSAGNVHLLAYLEKYSQKNIERAIFISLGTYGESSSSYETVAEATKAKALIENNQADKMQSFGLSFCKEYVTTPVNYLSYYEWHAERILGVLKNLSLPVHVIVGSSDKRLGGKWLDELHDINADLTTIEGAGHFFDDAYEFDLLDVVESILSTE